MQSRFQEVEQQLKRLRSVQNKHIGNLIDIENQMNPSFKYNVKQFIANNGNYHPELLPEAIALDKQIEKEQKALRKVRMQIRDLLRANPLNLVNYFTQKLEGLESELRNISKQKQLEKDLDTIPVLRRFEHESIVRYLSSEEGRLIERINSTKQEVAKIARENNIELAQFGVNPTQRKIHLVALKKPYDEKKVEAELKQLVTNKVISSYKFKENGIEITGPTSRAYYPDPEDASYLDDHETQLYNGPPEKKPSENKLPSWVMGDFKKPNYAATLKGSFNETHFRSAIDRLVETNLITSYKTTSNGIEANMPNNNKILINIKENKIYSNECTPESYDTAANLTLACGYKGWDMKDLVEAAQRNRKGADDNLYNAYAAGRTLGENFQFLNLPEKLKEDLEVKYRESARLQPGI